MEKRKREIERSSINKHILLRFLTCAPPLPLLVHIFNHPDIKRRPKLLAQMVSHWSVPYLFPLVILLWAALALYIGRHVGLETVLHYNAATIARGHYIGRREEICRDVGRETVRRTQEKEKYKRNESRR